MMQRKGSESESPMEQPAGWQRFLGLREHSLFRFAAAYAVAAWLIVQVTATIGPAFDLPYWFLRAVIVLALFGFFLTIGVAAFRQRGQSASVTGRRRAIVLALGLIGLVAAVAALGLLARDAVLGKEQVTIAVLPFTDLSPSKDKAYFAEGIAEEILTSLASDKSIKVLGRTSARQIERDPNPAAVRSALGVTHLLEGSARSAGEQLRVNVRLIDTADGAEVWEERYDGRTSDIFGFQDRIAATVADRLRGTLLKVRVRPSESTGVDAYQTYLAARALMRTRSKKTLSEALTLARKTISADPGYAPGHALYAELLFLLSNDPSSYGDIPVATARAAAIPHARRAIALAPDRPDGYAALGLVMPRDQAIPPLQKAIAMDPARAELRIWLGVALSEAQRNDEAFEQYWRAWEVEPLWPVALNRVTQIMSHSGHSAEAIAEVKRYLARGGEKGQALRFLASIAWAQGDLPAAIKRRRAALAIDPTLPFSRRALAIDLYYLGFGKQAVAIFPAEKSYAYFLVSGGRAALLNQAELDGARVWQLPDSELAIRALAAARSWPSLVTLFDARPRTPDICHFSAASAAVMVIALRKTGRDKDRVSVEGCLNAVRLQVSRQRWRRANDGYGNFEFGWASAAAAQNRRDDAIKLLTSAVQKGWIGQTFSPRLTDYPQFDGLTNDPRYAGLQRRIDASLARQRAEVLAQGNSAS